METEGLVSIRDLLRSKLIDAAGEDIGHLQDLAIGEDLDEPLVTCVGAHLDWTDRVGDVELVRPVEDIVLLFPWTEVDEFGRHGVFLKSRHPDIPVETASGKWMVRLDILNEQMFDVKGNRIHRVDDVLMEHEGDHLRLVGLEVSGALLLASPGLKHFIEEMKKKHGVACEEDIIPWQCIERIEEEAVIINERYKTEG